MAPMDDVGVDARLDQRRDREASSSIGKVLALAETTARLSPA